MKAKPTKPTAKTPTTPKGPTMAPGGSQRSRAWQLSQDMKNRRINNPTTPPP